MEITNCLTTHKNAAIHSWRRTWLNKNIGGVIVGIFLLFIVSIILLFHAQSWLIAKREQLTSTEKALTEIKNEHDIEKQYHDALNQKSNDILQFQRARFDKPTTLLKLKEQLKIWQNKFKIHTINVAIKDARPHNSGHGLMNLSLNISIKVLNDRSFYQLLGKLQQDAPGLIVVRHIDLKRTNNITHDTLNQLLTGKQAALIDGKIECNWIFISDGYISAH